jgi:hypothetical protein
VAVLAAGLRRSLRELWRPRESNPIASDASAGAGHVEFSLPGRPSIAIMPFRNLNGDSENEFIADGSARDAMTVRILHPPTLVHLLAMAYRDSGTRRHRVR